MSLPWVRLDANIATHDKTIAAMGMRGGKGAMCLYVFALAWSGGQGTDGHIPAAALQMLHGTKAEAHILEKVQLWDADPDGDGWWVRNWARRQESHEVTEAKRERARHAALARWHGPNVRAIR